jgi:hypothetical protein
MNGANLHTTEPCLQLSNNCTPPPQISKNKAESCKPSCLQEPRLSLGLSNQDIIKAKAQTITANQDTGLVSIILGHFTSLLLPLHHSSHAVFTSQHPGCVAKGVLICFALDTFPCDIPFQASRLTSPEWLKLLVP